MEDGEERVYREMLASGRVLSTTGIQHAHAGVRPGAEALKRGIS